MLTSQTLRRQKLDTLAALPNNKKKQTLQTMAACQASIEEIKHLYSLLVEQCGLTPDQAYFNEVQAILSEYGIVRANRKNFEPRSQLKNDLWRLEQWVQYADSVLASLPSSPPHKMENLADCIQEHRDLLLDLDCHRNLLVSLNAMQEQLDEESCARLDVVSTRWPDLVERAANWQLALQTALSQNDDFHKTILVQVPV
ncbi:uncharacterized protein LOC103512692 [Diaphorina citri]|uniref:Uncharacterized protein LOC103512692 n=1 Tax=Diaphorina citri TaxID=121845 RepID=A0A1S3D6V2_DIACI|nr:uncharacterized protein LOC103512692 [Diaphorina citri]